MTKKCKTIITTFKDGEVDYSYENGILINEVKSGWKLIDTASTLLPTEDPKILKIEVFEYVLENEKGILLG